jgi:hypothetical protein
VASMAPMDAKPAPSVSGLVPIPISRSPAMERAGRHEKIAPAVAVADDALGPDSNPYSERGAPSASPALQPRGNGANPDEGKLEAQPPPRLAPAPGL